MLVDAIRAESFRLSKSRTTWFWSVFFVPIMAVLFGALTSFVVHSNAGKLSVDGKTPQALTNMLTSGPLDLGRALVTTAGDLAGPPVLLFLLIGAATLYAGDYRWETWRLISARNTRVDLLLGKLAVVAGLALVAMLVLLAAGVVENVIRAGIFGRSLTFSMDGAAIGQFLGYVGLSWLRILQFTMMGMLGAVMTRSLLVALFVPLVLGVVQFFSPQALMSMGIMPDSWLAMLVNPAAATDAIKALIEGGAAAARLPEGIIVKSWISLGLWTLLPLAGALVWFKRQDLSKE